MEEYLYPIPNRACMPRQIFLRRSLKAHRYFNGTEGVQNCYQSWAKWGKPDLIIVRCDGWELSFKMSLLPRAYEYFIRIDYWDLVILSVPEEMDSRNSYEYNKLPLIKTDLEHQI